MQRRSGCPAQRGKGAGKERGKGAKKERGKEIERGTETETSEEPQSVLLAGCVCPSALSLRPSCRPSLSVLSVLMNNAFTIKPVSAV